MNLQKRRMEIGLIVACAVWGSTFFIVKQATNHIDPIALIAYRFLAATALLLPICYWRRLPLTQQWWGGLITGLVLFFVFITQTIGLTLTTAANSGFITGLFVATVPLFTPFFGRKVTRQQWLAVAISLLGLLILTGGIHGMNRGDLLTLICSLFCGLHILCSDRYMQRQHHALIFSCQQFAVVGVLSAISGWLWGSDFSLNNMHEVYTLTYLTLFPTIGCLTMMFLAQKTIAPVRVALICAFEPVFSAAFAWTLGGETFHWHQAFGGLLIFLALLISEAPLVAGILRDKTNAKKDSVDHLANTA